MTLPVGAASALRAVNTLFSNATVTVTPRASLNDYGEGVPGTPATYTDARVNGKVQEIRTATGEERISTKVVSINGSATVSPDDGLTLPDATEWLVLAVELVTFGTDVVTTVVYL